MFKGLILAIVGLVCISQSQALTHYNVKQLAHAKSLSNAKAHSQAKTKAKAQHHGHIEYHGHQPSLVLDIQASEELSELCAQVEEGIEVPADLPADLYEAFHEWARDNLDDFDEERHTAGQVILDACQEFGEAVEESDES
ncbi:UNKNOWN [Stylonychia lemnae]|uniref:Uncharacterized protein n=1 Tax=Stylonychia lemnae TaxID=5949 RepID=A0A078B584_STYLE|nr:UNKNOWN [Stylonychia lemnae]|eukprot:CDW88422.1 UNKNOWN [Stylonychia lemnae]